MEISEKVQHESEFEVKFYKEGVFWIAYEQSAYAVTKIKPYKVTKKYVKVLAKDVVSVGFPENSLNDLTSGMALKQDGDKQLIFRLPEAINMRMFQSWRESVSERVLQKVSTSSEDYSEIIHRLKTFSIANSTPMECMLFLSELQKMIY